MIKNITDAAIDSVQNGRKFLVDAVVKNDALATQVKDLIDVQTAYTKQSIDSTYNSVISISKLLVEKNFYVDTFNNVRDTVTKTVKKDK